MSAFIATGAASSFTVECDSFWPPIDAANLRATLRIDASVSDARLETAVVAAIISTTRDLANWRLAKQAAGYATLHDVPGQLINNQTEFAHLYARAIEAGVAAEVCERYRSYDSTGAGDSKAEDQQYTVDDYRRDHRWAVRDILGEARTTVVLL